ncbi:ATP-binding protein [Trichocoleus desertorum AS-A10]|uniref:sensor histidine kinase n=1 Tax=Trichocoleus desertorum TaxID=1481672 RepID=UPI003296AA48
MTSSLSSTTPTEPLMQPQFTLSPQLLAKAFPFHFVFKGDRTIVQSGEVLQRLIPDIIGAQLDKCFQIQRPIIQTADFAAITRQSNSIFMLKSLHSEMTLRGQMMPIEDCGAIFFLGSPVVTEISQLNQIGIKLKDFAIHDSAADFLFLLQAKGRLMDELAERELKLKDTLRGKEEIALLAEARARDVEQALENLQKTQAQLIQAEKMSGLGQMVAGIAHEINNPVNFINGNLTYTDKYVQDLLTLVELYQQYFPQASPEIIDFMEEMDLEFVLSDLPRLVASMQMGSCRIRDIVLSLRNFSRLDEAEQKDVDLHEGIDSTLLILNHKLKQGIEVVQEYGDLPKVLCYPAQLNQLFMNIISNAADALLEADIKSKQIVIQTSVDDSNQVYIRIQDNGHGISPEIKEKIFNPFFTTKPAGKGTGLGLSISQQIIEKHQGTIEVVSELGKGTEFVIKIPISLVSKA